MFQENILLSQNSNYKIGGPARFFFDARNADETIKGVAAARKAKIPIFVLGGGTNILFNDAGFNGLVLRPNIRLMELRGSCLRVGAGLSVGELLDFTIKKNLSGMEWAGGLPGTVGGALYGNAGCFNGEIKDIAGEVVSLDISGPKPKIIKRNNSECDFGYRSSVFKKNKGKEIILEVLLNFKEGDGKAIKEAIEEKISYRKERQPLEYPNIGSIFKNIDLKRVPRIRHREFGAVIKTDPFPIVPAAHLIHEAGLKGVSYGGAMISPKHPNFIVNILNATSDDVKELINLAKSIVHREFGIKLEEEIEYLQ